MNYKKFELNDEEKQAFRKYLEISMNKDGFIKCKDIITVFTALGFRISETDMEPLLTMFDTNNERQLHLDEITDNVDMMTLSERHRQTEAQTRDAFRMFDKCDDGYIRQNEFIQVMTANVSDFAFAKEEAVQIWQQLVDTYGTDENGKLNYSDFVAVLHGANEDSVVVS